MDSDGGVDWSDCDITQDARIFIMEVGIIHDFIPSYLHIIQQIVAYMCIHLAIQVSVISFASSTNPISSRSCVVPRTALSSAEKIHA